MHADTAAIERTGFALGGIAAELGALAAALPAVTDSAPVLFGPVADALVAALREAVADTTRAVTELGSQLGLAEQTAGRIAVSYRDTEHHVGQAISALGG
ncbi:NAD-dependent epimerase/dehydratase [Mycolicibacterium canariasense]|uniref:NAD-dependent epimerase/dehydratase n=1 Tax=Mycolicibacterium canariasense TaxID=228230 RepID=A0A117IC84_MYCCR|nr:hypothetical protein [Mycolicibacterium canariasense]MCV7208164.1 hypothetical protein [Mycolicibacterium canariasense]ORV09495.1 hypothetical protein AWB94_09575 [Mycolicibacterium canariasense]GAS99092.1 NAD-dependent epimerase/dehydratase [Mycolicibacterium canariasense]